MNQIDRACRLTEAQKKKMHLAGRGDIQRFFDRYEAGKDKFQLAKEKFPLAGDNEQLEQEVFQVAFPLKAALRAGLFQENSLLYKSVRRTLTDEQTARYTVLEEQRRAVRHRATIERAVARLGKEAPQLAAKPQTLVRLLAEGIKPLRNAVASPYDVYYVLYMMGRLPEDKLRPLFNAKQWTAIRRQLDQYKRLEVPLRQKGLLPDEGRDGAEAAPRGPAS